MPDNMGPVDSMSGMHPPRIKLLDRPAGEVLREVGAEPAGKNLDLRSMLCRVLGVVGNEATVPVKVSLAARILRGLLAC
jgi:hypothetical protein